MPKVSIMLVVGIAYVCIMVGIAQGSVGYISTNCGEPYPWHLPWLMLMTMGLPLALGYLGGMEDKQ